MVERRLDAKWSGFLILVEYWTVQPFEYRTNGRYLVFFMVEYSNGRSST